MSRGTNGGYSESVLLDGDNLICTPGGEKHTVVALNKQTGELKWKTIRPGDTGAGHASMSISEIGGVRVYVQVTASGPIGIRAADGQLLWSYPLERTTAVIPSPIVRDNLVFFAAGYKRGGALLKQVPGPDGQVKIEEVYPVTKDLANKHGGMVLVGDFLYGDSDDQGIPFCADLMTGAVKWRKRGMMGRGSASFAAADGRLYIRFANGIVVLAKASPEDYVEVGSFKTPDSGERPSWSHPVSADGKLYLREQDRISCYDIKAK
ncbi:MAG: Pyrrolo-quinoline quinone [Planctomycetaceae bacterium]|nr:Pyrrolo-quinoline quinone [Planctomycetaceae bacterium]